MKTHIAILLACLTLTACHAPKEPTFWLGADISGTTELEQSGVTLYNAQGEPCENTLLMQSYGINAIRLRVWVHPENRIFVPPTDPNGTWESIPTYEPSDTPAWCSPEDVLLMAQRAQALGMAIMIDFHYSDWWADPGKQNIPAAWADMSYEEMRDAAAEHTRSTLALLREHGISVRWVQIGNETTHGFLWPMARAEQNMEHYAGITDACYEASKSIYPDAPCIVHLDCGSDLRRYRFIFDGLEQYGARYDMIGMSMYPYWDMQEHLTESEDETLTRIVANIDSLYHIYGRETMITEIGYHADYADAGYDYLLRAMRTLRDSTDGHCHGVFYWAPELEGSYPLGAFRNHRPTHIMDAFRDL